MNGIIYCRVSSKEQIEGTSLESQELACRDFARTRHITVLKTFVERGESAKFANRTQLLELIDFCQKNRGRVQVLLVWKVDRFARNVSDHFSVKAMLTKYGVQILSVTEPIDSNAEGKLMETILAGFAQFDNDVRAMRSVQGMRRKIQEGIFPWKPPLGYVSSTVNGKKKTQSDRPSQPLFDLLQKAWRTFTTGAYTKAEIGRLMSAWGIVASKGKSLSPQSLDNLFRNHYYAGILVDPWSGGEYPGQHIPMVTPEEFAKVQQIIRRRNRAIPHQRVRPEFPLRGLARCSQCLRYLTGSFTRGRNNHYAYYHCANRACGQRSKSYRVRALHDEFEVFLDQVSPKSELIEKLKQMIIGAAKRRQGFIEARNARLREGQERATRRLDELIRMRADRLITDEEFLANKTSLADRHLCEESADSTTISPEQVTAHLDEIAEPLSHLRNTWRSLPETLRPRFHRLLLPAGFVNGNVGTAELGLLFRALGQVATGNSTVVPLVGKSWNQIEQEIIALSDFFRECREVEKVS